MLEGVLQRAAGASDGILGVYLIGMDGLPVAASGPIDRLPLDVIVASYADLLRRVGDSSREADLGEVSELVVSHDSLRLVLRVVTGEYAVMALLGPEGSLGRARYELLKAALDLATELNG